MAFQIVKDLLGGGSKPATIDIFYNGDLAAASTTRRYAGSFVKRMDIDDVDHGWFYTFAGLATAMENVVGILAEDQGITDNYLPDDATYGMKMRKMYPVFPSSVIRGEYGRYDAAGTANTDTGATCAAGSPAFVAASTGTADYINGGWIYMVDGAAAGELHYVLDDDGAGNVTLATAMTNAVVAADTFLFISPAASDFFRINATYTGFLSEIDTDACQHYFLGLMHYIQAPGVALQPLQRNLHDGQIIANARFFHDVIFTGATDAASALTTSALIRGIAAA
jgi:hypothetical protein